MRVSFLIIFVRVFLADTHRRWNRSVADFVAVLFKLKIMEIQIENARKHHALAIARLIMQAMNGDCCHNFMGKGYTLDDFERVMTSLVLRDDTQYSYLNTMVVLGGNGGFIGMCVSYDGARLHELRRPFVEAMRTNFGRDFSSIDDETGPGELYIDSLAVNEDYRGNGVATLLLREMIKKTKALGLPAAGLLVDKGNPKAERLYRKIGFGYVADTTWGGHEMHHLQYKV